MENPQDDQPAKDRSRFLPDLRDTLALVGLVFLAAGAWMIYPPAAFLLTGAVLLGVGLFYGGPRWHS